MRSPIKPAVLVNHPSPGVKGGKQDHLENRQRVKNHSYSFVVCHILRMKVSHILAGQLLKFCKCGSSLQAEKARSRRQFKAFTGISYVFTP